MSLKTQYEIITLWFYLWRKILFDKFPNSYLGTYDITKQSGLPISADLTTEDKAYADNGFECEIPIDAPEVRYIRIAIDKTFNNTKYSYTGELKFYGQVKE